MGCAECEPGPFRMTVTPSSAGGVLFGSLKELLGITKKGLPLADEATYRLSLSMPNVGKSSHGQLYTRSTSFPFTSVPSYLTSREFSWQPEPPSGLGYLHIAIHLTFGSIVRIFRYWLEPNVMGLG